jgi:hypothetical protein
MQVGHEITLDLDVDGRRRNSALNDVEYMAVQVRGSKRDICGCGDFVNMPPAQFKKVLGVEGLPIKNGLGLKNFGDVHEMDMFALTVP